jgi:hypothetical protein
MSALSFSIAGAAEATGLSESHLDRAIKAGLLRVKRSSEDETGNPTGKRVILASALEDYLEALPDG